MSKEKIHNDVSWLSQKNIMIVAVAVVAIVLVAAIVGIVIMVCSGDVQPAPSTEPSASSDATEATDAPTEATEPSTEATNPPTEEPTEAATVPTAPPATTPRPTTPQPTQPVKTVISLPYTIPGTSLVIQRIANYDGIYLEDASNAEVTDVAMMLLYNTGTTAVEYANFTLTYDDKTLQFTVSAIPAGGKVAVQEAARQSCASGDLTDCAVDIASMDKMEMSEGVIQIEDNGNNSLTVTNLTDADIVTVRVFYKYYLEEESAYVGGITYTAKISNLKAGESVVITPAHYASNGSIVVMVRTYDTDA